MKHIKYLIFVLTIFNSYFSLAQQPLINHFSDIFALNSNTIWIVESDGILRHTTDAGSNWMEYGNYLIPDSKIFFINSTEGWRISGDRIYFTTNSGENWLLDSEVLNFNFRDINFLNDSVGFALGFDSENKIFRTTNAGNNWSVVFDSSYSSSFGNLFILNEQNIWAYKINDIYHSSDLGNSWETIYHWNVIVGYYFHKLFFFDENDGILSYNYDGFVVAEGKLLSTTDRGYSWQDYGPYIFEFGLSDYYFNSKSTGCAATGNSEILFTQNSGNSWEVLQDYNSLSSSIYKFCPIVDSVAWAISSNEILFTDDGWHTFSIKGTISDVDDNSNDGFRKFSLSQNYPNPFNPSTKIKYEIPDQVRNDSRLVTLKVYDVLGNEIATLVNEEKQPGTYEVEFNTLSGIRNLVSGIYFYQLKSGEYVKTRKMILIK